DEQQRILLAMGEGLELPPEASADTGDRSVFMDLYAAQARFHMRTFGTTREQIAAVAAKNHWHSQFNPLAQYRFPMTAAEVMADRMVSWPLTRSMCAPMSDGSGAIVLCAQSQLRHFK